MRSYRVLFFAVSLCIIFSIICGPTYASDIWTVDGNVDPWGDLDEIENWRQDQEDQQATVSQAPAEDDEQEGTDGGISLFSLNDDSTVRYFCSSDYITFGNRYYAASFPPGCFTITNDRYASISKVSVVEGSGAQLKIPAGTYVDYYANVAYLANEVQSLVVGGGGQFALRGGGLPYCFAYPDTVQVTVNGTPVGDVYACDSSGNFTITGFDFVLTDDISTLGYRFTYSSAENLSLTSTNYSTNAFLGVSIIDDGVFTVTVKADEPEYKGLLGTIIGWLTSIWDGITSIPALILDGVKSLFVPTDEQLQALSDQYDGLFEEKLGFVYQLLSWTVDSFTGFKDTLLAGEAYTFTFPGIRFPHEGEMIEILPEQEVSLENGFMDVVRPVLGTIVSIIAVVGFANVCFDMVVAFISGASYFEFRKGKKGSDDE